MTSDVIASSSATTSFCSSPTTMSPEIRLLMVLSDAMIESVTDEELVRAKIATLQGETGKDGPYGSSGVASSTSKRQDKKLTTKDYENMMDNFAFAKNSRMSVEEELTNAMNTFYDEQMEERRLALVEIQNTVGFMM